MRGMFPTERHSLKAINRLQVDFPYAATLLIYTVLERWLKLYLLQERKTLTEVNCEYKTHRGKGPSLNDSHGFNHADFIKKFLSRSDLFDLGEIYKVRPRNKYSKPRNDVFHSNLFLSDELSSGKTSRDEKNRKYLQDAKAHLIEASRLYFRQEITESNGSLRFKR